MSNPDIDHLLSLDTTDPSAALEFRRGVAELVGWRVGRLNNTTWFLLDPEGAAVGKSNSEEGAWTALDGLADDLRECVPAYETSCDAALTLPLYGTLFYLHRTVDGWLCSIDWRDDDFTLLRVDEKANTPALAICRAYLRYRRAQSAPVATADEEA